MREDAGLVVLVVEARARAEPLLERQPRRDAQGDPGRDRDLDRPIESLLRRDATDEAEIAAAVVSSAVEGARHAGVRRRRPLRRWRPRARRLAHDYPRQ